MAQKPINTEQVVKHLSRVFERVTYGMERAARTKNPRTGQFEKNRLYQLQEDFAYFVDGIQRNPAYFVPKVISDCNAFLDELVKETSK
jgi:hypothetical protein